MVVDGKVTCWYEKFGKILRLHSPKWVKSSFLKSHLHDSSQLYEFLMQRKWKEYILFQITPKGQFDIFFCQECKMKYDFIFTFNRHYNFDSIYKHLFKFPYQRSQYIIGIKYVSFILNEIYFCKINRYFRIWNFQSITSDFSLLSKRLERI